MGRFMKKIITFLPVIGLSLILQGCEMQQYYGIFTKERVKEETEVKEDELGYSDMGNNEAPAYEVPVQTTNVKIDRIGYEPDEVKVALFEGESIPRSFYVRNRKNGDTVYEGRIIKSADGKYFGDFSALMEEGDYYIQADYIGCSYTFKVHDKLNGEIMRDAQKQYYLSRCGVTLTEQYAGENAHNACHTALASKREDVTVQMDVSTGWHMDEDNNRDVLTACNTMLSLLLGYEFYSDSFDDEVNIPESDNDIADILDELRFETDWLGKMQDINSGAVYKGITARKTGGNDVMLYVEGPDMVTTTAYAAVMAKFSYIYQSIDPAYATVCLKLADRAFRYQETNTSPDEPENSWRFLAAAELYRATGYGYYKTIVDSYIYTDILSKMQEDLLYYLGGVTYISTKQSVDLNVCKQIMAFISKDVENICAESKKSFWGVPEKDKDDKDALMDNVIRLCVVNYVIPNYEYGTVIENYLHYFRGRNESAKSYMEELKSQCVSNAKLIFLLSEIGHEATQTF